MTAESGEIFPDVVAIPSSSGRQGAVCGIRMESLSAASVFWEAGPSSEPSGENGSNEHRLHRLRAQMLAAVAGWPPTTTLELHYRVAPNLVVPARGRIDVWLLIRSYAETPEAAVVEVLKKHSALHALLGSHAREAVFENLAESELQSALSWAPSVSAIAITRVVDEMPLGRKGEALSIGFTSREPVAREAAGNHLSIRYRWPWLPSLDKWRTMLETLLYSVMPLMLVVRVRSAVSPARELESLVAALEQAEVTLAGEVRGRSASVFTQSADAVRQAVFGRMARIKEAGLDTGVFLVSQSVPDESLVRIIGQAISRPRQIHPDRELQEIMAGGFAHLPVSVENLNDPEFFPEDAPFTPDETACAFRFPSPPHTELPGIEVCRTKTVLADLPPDVCEAPGRILIGNSKSGGIEVPVHLALDDRMRHMFVMGQTGTGKSTLLEHMILQDIGAGRGLCVVDPHGELVDEILGKIPPERIGDVIIVDPLDYGHPVGLNLIEWSTIQERDFLIDELMNLFDRMYDLKITGGPVFEQYFRGAIRLLTGDKPRTDFVPNLLEMELVFLDSTFRRYLLSTTKEQSVIDFWKSAEDAGGDIQLRNIVPYITSKLTRLFSDVTVRRIIGQSKTTFSFRDVVDGGRILLVKTGKGRFGRLVSSLLSGIIVTRIQVAIMSRAGQRPGDRRDFFLYVDEFQNLVSESFGEMLDEVRKYRLGLILANQYADQLLRSDGGKSINLLTSVLGNVGTKILFRTGSKDAEMLGTEFRPVFSRTDLLSIPNRQALVKTTTSRRDVSPFSMATVKNPAAYSGERKQDCENASRSKYSVEASEADRDISHRRNALELLIIKRGGETAGGRERPRTPLDELFGT